MVIPCHTTCHTFTCVMPLLFTTSSFPTLNLRCPMPSHISLMHISHRTSYISRMHISHRTSYISRMHISHRTSYISRMHISLILHVVICHHWQLTLTPVAQMGIGYAPLWALVYVSSPMCYNPTHSTTLADLPASSFPTLIPRCPAERYPRCQPHATLRHLSGLGSSSPTEAPSAYVSMGLCG
jgi:hypothetical protein